MAHGGAKKMETFNRRDRVKITGLKQEARTSKNRRFFKSYLKEVFEMSCAINAAIALNDISIANRLPSRDEMVKPIIMMFSRRVAKMNSMKSKIEKTIHETLEH